MTIGILKMPRMGETMEEGRLVDWLVQPGQAFRRGQEILEVETDKTIVEFPALGDGTVVETLVETGHTVSVGTPIARIDVGDGPDWTADAAPADAAEAPDAPEEAGEGAAQAPRAAAAAGAPAPGRPVATPGPEGAGRPRATPLARRLAREKGVELGTLAGSGRRGRIERADVEAASGAPGEARKVAGVTCLEAGPASGAPVVLLHGFGADHASWGGLQARLAGAGRHTLGFDLPGHGTTEHEARGPGDLAGPLDAAMSELGLGPVHLVAHSMGAIAAVALARSRDVGSLTLISPAGLGHAIDAEFLRGLARAESPGEISHLLLRVTDGPHGLSPAMLERIHADLGRRRLTGLAEALLGGSGQAVSIRADLARLAERIPVRLILGGRDRILDWRDALDVSPRIAIHHLPRAGHSPHWEALPDVAAIITDITS